MHLVQAMSWLRQKDCLGHGEQIQGCREVLPSAGCFLLLVSLPVTDPLLCSSSCSLVFLLISRLLCNFCLHLSLSHMHARTQILPHIYIAHICEPTVCTSVKYVENLFRLMWGREEDYSYNYSI